MSILPKKKNLIIDIYLKVFFNKINRMIIETSKIFKNFLKIKYYVL